MQDDISNISDIPSPPAPELDPMTVALCRRVRELRRQQDWTLEQLSKASGVSRSMLSQIERAQANPTLAVASRIAKAFGLGLGQLVDAPAGGGGIELIHGDDPNCLFRNDAQCTIRTLSPLNLEKQVEFYEVTLAGGKALRSTAHYRGAREIFACQQGAATIRSGDDTVRLRRGDSAHYRADVNHAIENTGRGRLIGYLVVNYTRA